MSKTLINTILIITGCVVLYILGQQLISEKKVPSLGDYLASSTSETASSTNNSNSSSSPKTSSMVSLMQEIASSSVQQDSATSTAYLNATSSKRIAFDFPTTTVFNSTGSIKVFIASNDADREQGLSDITWLPSAEGVLFVFDSPGSYGFWMKDMHFPLDLIWIDSNKTIVGVTKNALPSSYPFVFMPPYSIMYVIEMNAGSVAKFGLTTGTQLKFSVQ